MKEHGLRFNLWDPLISQQDHDHLNTIGFETLKSTPKNVEVAFVCVNHDAISEFLNTYDGILYDYTNPTIPH
jgi:hypothetical protein